MTQIDGASPNAWNDAHRIAMLKTPEGERAQRAPGRRGARGRSADAHPGRERRGHVREALRDAREPAAPRARSVSRRRCRSVGTSASASAITIAIAPKIAGHDRHAERRGPGQDARAQAEAEHARATTV